MPLAGRHITKQLGNLLINHQGIFFFNNNNINNINNNNNNNNNINKSVESFTDDDIYWDLSSRTCLNLGERWHRW